MIFSRNTLKLELNITFLTVTLHNKAINMYFLTTALLMYDSIVLLSCIGLILYVWYWFVQWYIVHIFSFYLPISYD